MKPDMKILAAISTADQEETVSLPQDAVDRISRKTMRKIETKPKSIHKMHPWYRGLAAGAAAAAVLVVGAAAAVQLFPVLSGIYPGSVYDESAVIVGQSVSDNGWTMTMTDLLADDTSVYIGMTLTAPDGIVPDEQLALDSSFTIGDCSDFSWQFTLAEDENRNDNTIPVILRANAEDSSSTLLGEKLELTIDEIYHTEWNAVDNRSEKVTDGSGNWSFSVKLPEEVNVLQAEPGQTVSVFGAEAELSEVMVTPLSVQVIVSGEGLRNHHEWAAFDTDNEVLKGLSMECLDTPVTLHYADGTNTVLTVDNCSFAGSRCSGGWSNDPDVSEITILLHPNQFLIDTENLTEITVCGATVEISE